MHNWAEFQFHCQEKVADALRWAENERRVEAARRGARARRRESRRRRQLSREPRAATLVLARGDLLSIKVGRRGLAVTCVAGRTWYIEPPKC